MGENKLDNHNMTLIKSIKSHLRDGGFHRWLQRQRGKRSLVGWERAGFPNPPPQAYKQKLVRELARKYRMRTLVETGTCYGNMVAASMGIFDVIYSIELFDDFYEQNQRRFARFPKVRLRHGDSAVELPKILDELREPALFWLDAHYSGTGTGRADLDTPIEAELREIAARGIPGHVILIDDARDFTGENDYPTVEQCREMAAHYWPKSQFSVEFDVIRILPEQNYG